MAYTRPEIVSKVTRLDKDFFENAFDGIDERPTREEANGTYAPVGSTLPRGLSAFGNLPPVTYNSGMPGNQAALSDGLSLTETTKKRFNVIGASEFVRLVFFGWIANNGTAEVVAPNPVSVTAGLERVDGVVVPVFFGGSPSATLHPGATLISDPIPIGIALGDANRYFFVRACATVASIGQKWPLSVSPVTSVGGDGVFRSAAADDRSLSGTIPALSARTFGPSLIVGANGADAKLKIVGVHGDSIATGTRDGIEDRGPFVLAASPRQIPVVKATSAGESLANTVLPANFRRWSILSGCTDIVCETGVNDLRNISGVLATIQANALKVWGSAKRTGARVWQVTITPTNTTSTDAWATAANQTISQPATHANRNAFNAWVRDGAPLLAGAVASTGTTDPTAYRAGSSSHPLAGYIEFTDAVETARDSGIWKDGLCGDGLHPSQAGHNALSAKLQEHPVFI